MRGKRILLVDGDNDRRQLLQNLLTGARFDVHVAKDGIDATILAQNREFDVAVVELRQTDGDGIACMDHLHQNCPDLPIIIVADNGSIIDAVEVINKGAFTYIPKPFDPKELVVLIEEAIRNKCRKTKQGSPNIGMQGSYGIVGKSRCMSNILETIDRISHCDSTVAIYGASGTGKEMIARAIQQTSQRRYNRFIMVNCSAIPEHLMESELFGHEKGAFTSASSSSPGLFKQADKGTLFLDEIGEIPLNIQTKLLRVLQERQVRPVGSVGAIDLDIRIIVATNKNLEDEVRSGRFREDLFYRIHVIPIELPLLRERKEDIPLLADHFLKKCCQKMRIRYRPLSRHIMDRLMHYDWPGNIRELENLIERIVALHEDGIVPEELILADVDPHPPSISPLTDARNQFEKSYLHDLLAHTRGNITKASKIAGRYRADLYQMMRKHDLSPVDYKS